MKCNKFMWWAFGANSWACKKLGICLCDSKPDPVPPEPPIPPDPPQPPDPPDPPITIKVDVCTKSGKKATKICKAIGCVESKTFPGGGAPHLDCPKHVIGEMKTPRKYARSGIWDFGAVMLTAWDKDGEADALEQWFFKCREIFSRGVQTMADFLFVESGLKEHKHWKNKAPYLWMKDKKKYDLSQPSPRFWELAEKMMRIVKLFNEPGKARYFQPCLTMQKYDERPFKKNINGVKGLKTQAALPFVGNLIRWWIDMTREVYGPKHKPPFKCANEFTHGKKIRWDGKLIPEFVFNAYYHRYLTDIAVFEYGIPIWKETVDVSKSEGCAQDVNEWRYAERFKVWLGYKPEELVIKRNIPKKCVLMEKHACGSVQSWKDNTGYYDTPNFFMSKNKEMLCSVDGGTGQTKDGKGYRIGGPNGFRWPDKEQWRDTCRTVAKEAVTRGNRRIYFEWAAPEVFMEFKNGKRVFRGYIPDPNYKLLDYEFLDIMIEEIDRAYGQS